MADERVVFGNTAQALFQVALKGRLSAGALGRLREAGLDVTQPVAVAYPVDQWRRLLVIAAEDFAPGVPQEEAWRRLGEQMVHGLVQTVLGKAMATLWRVVGPARALQRLNRSLRNSDNFVEGTLTELGPGRYSLALNDTMGLPSYYQGILLAAARMAGAKEPRVEVARVEGPGCTLQIEWQA